MMRIAIKEIERIFYCSTLNFAEEDNAIGKAFASDEVLNFFQNRRDRSSVALKQTAHRNKHVF